ncbi:MAG: ABC transporter permease subunit [Sulfitobacter sp.]
MMQTRRLAFFWLVLAGLTLALYFGPAPLGALVQFPAAWVLPVSDALNGVMNGFVALFGPMFKVIGQIVEWPIITLRNIFTALPWSVLAALFIALTYAAAGGRLAIFVSFTLLYMAGIGYWQESMATLAIVAISVPAAVGVGFLIGVWGFYSARARRIILPTLDLLQTIPAFAYLLPILILFGFGTAVGLVASVLYAFAPMVRNTILGLTAVPDSLRETGVMSGATPWQLFWKVRLPSAKEQILLGVNQTTMASLSMVIIASIIGGTNDIGWEVLSQMRKAQFGESLLAGFVIALMAMALDRATYACASRNQQARHSASFWTAAGIALATLCILSTVLPFLRVFPEALTFYPAEALNHALERFVIHNAETIQSAKTSVVFFLMLPAKIGLQNAISPFTWGIALTPALCAAYTVLVCGIAALLMRLRRWNAAALTVLIGVILFIGLTNMPWIALCSIIILSAYVSAGRYLAIGSALGLAFLLLSGTWAEAMLSLYLCGVAVIMCFIFGTSIGVLASESTVVSRGLRPVLDTLQTMPLFVILIPFVMIFKIGEFTALLAVMAYAIVPAIRYTEHGLRAIPSDVIEAATALGTTRWQLLRKVKLPLAGPAIMLGLNQTIIYGIGMLVITALVGTNGLGQKVYIGLGNGDFGVGMTAGIGMAIVAITADRITQSISQRMQRDLGFASAAA